MMASDSSGFSDGFDGDSGDGESSSSPSGDSTVPQIDHLLLAAPKSPTTALKLPSLPHTAPNSLGQIFFLGQEVEAFFDSHKHSFRPNWRYVKSLPGMGSGLFDSSEAVFGLQQGWCKGQITYIHPQEELQGKKCTVQFVGPFVESFHPTWEESLSHEVLVNERELRLVAGTECAAVETVQCGGANVGGTEGLVLVPIEKQISSTNQTRPTQNSNSDRQIYTQPPHKKPLISVFMLRYYDYYSDRKPSEYKISSEFAMQSLIEDCGIKALCKLNARDFEVFSLFVRQVRGGFQKKKNNISSI